MRKWIFSFILCFFAAGFEVQAQKIEQDFDVSHLDNVLRPETVKAVESRIQFYQRLSNCYRGKTCEDPKEFDEFKNTLPWAIDVYRKCLALANLDQFLRASHRKRLLSYVGFHQTIMIQGMPGLFGLKATPPAVEYSDEEERKEIIDQLAASDRFAIEYAWKNYNPFSPKELEMSPLRLHYVYQSLDESRTHYALVLSELLRDFPFVVYFPMRRPTDLQVAEALERTMKKSSRFRREVQDPTLWPSETLVAFDEEVTQVLKDHPEFTSLVLKLKPDANSSYTFWGWLRSQLTPWSAGVAACFVASAFVPGLSFICAGFAIGVAIGTTLWPDIQRYDHELNAFFAGVRDISVMRKVKARFLASFFMTGLVMFYSTSVILETAGLPLTALQLLGHEALHKIRNSAVMWMTIHGLVRVFFKENTSQALIAKLGIALASEIGAEGLSFANSQALIFQSLHSGNFPSYANSLFLSQAFVKDLALGRGVGGG